LFQLFVAENKTWAVQRASGIMQVATMQTRRHPSTENTQMATKQRINTTKSVKGLSLEDPP
jgi:hypothetical protein